jgi:Nuclear pore protein 84 / 107
MKDWPRAKKPSPKEWVCAKQTTHMSQPSNDDDADAAAAAIMASLDQWTSPHLGTFSATNAAATTVDDMDMDDYDDVQEAALRGEAYVYQGDTDAWLQNDQDDEERAMNQEPPLLSTTTQQQQQLPLRRTMAHRAGTPVMSNASKAGHGSTTTVAFMEETANEAASQAALEDDPPVPYNVQSPWVVRHPRPSSLAQTSSPRGGVGMQDSPAVTATSPNDATVYRSPIVVSQNKYTNYRRYHDAVAAWMRQKQRWRHDKDNDDMDTTSTADAAPMTEAWVQRHKVAADVALLSALNLHAWSLQCYPEGNAWKLWHMLHPLGLAATWDWNNTSPSSLQHHRASLASYLQHLARQVDKTPAALVAELMTPTQQQQQPLVWRRRLLVLQWLECCFSEVLPATATRPRVTKMDTSTARPENLHLLEQGFYRTDQDDELLHSSLLLILAGQFPQALQLMRDSDVSWRAALWSGGAPHDCVEIVDTTNSSSSSSSSSSTEEDETIVLSNQGNPRRALWRRMMWLHADVLHSTSSGCPYDTAIAAVLGSHVTAALDCAVLRTWDRGLYAIWRAMMDRTVDELLHAHNNYRRPLNPPFPGAAFVESELDQLETTADLAGMDEAQALGILHSAPFEEMRGEDDWVLQVTAGLLVGRTALGQVMERAIEQLEMSTDRLNMSEQDLRFLTHVSMYWHSLSLDASSPSSSTRPESFQWQTALLLEYVQHFHNQGYWDLIVLYASFLPEECILSDLPAFLCGIESQQDRAIIVHQLHEFLPRAGLDLQVLRRIVGLTLSDSEIEVDRGRSSHMIPTRLDVRKMRSILWLFIRDEHHIDAVIEANTLLRQFLKAGNKLPSAAMLVQDVLVGFLEKMTTFPWDRAPHVFKEHMDFLRYIEANDAVQAWKKVTDKTMWSFPTWSNSDNTDFNVIAQTIAASAEQKKRVETIREASSTVVCAADKACKALRLVLQSRGGWLSTDGEEDGDNIGDKARLIDLEHLHGELLPHTVLLYHNVCVETAAWMSKSIVQAVQVLGSDLCRKEAIRLVDDAQSSGERSAFSPCFWTGKGLQLVNMIENDRYNIRCTFDLDALKTLVTLVAETAELDLKYKDYER